MIWFTFITVLMYFTVSCCEARLNLQCALEGDPCLGHFQCCSALCYSGRCVAPNCLNDGQLCASFIGFGECCSGYCGIDFRCHHRAPTFQGRSSFMRNRQLYNY